MLPGHYRRPISAGGPIKVGFKRYFDPLINYKKERKKRNVKTRKTNKQTKKIVVIDGPPLTKLSGSAHATKQSTSSQAKGTKSTSFHMHHFVPYAWNEVDLVPLASKSQQTTAPRERDTEHQSSSGSKITLTVKLPVKWLGSQKWYYLYKTRKQHKTQQKLTSNKQQQNPPS